MSSEARPRTVVGASATPAGPPPAGCRAPGRGNGSDQEDSNAGTPVAATNITVRAVYH